MTDWSVEVHRCGEHPAAANAYYAPEVGAWLCNVCGGFCDRLECVVVRRHPAPPMDSPEPVAVASLAEFQERFGPSPLPSEEPLGTCMNHGDYWTETCKACEHEGAWPPTGPA